MHSFRLVPFKGASWGLPFNKRPCWFWRFTQWLVFGFHWEKVE